MPLLDSLTGKVRREYTVASLTQAAQMMRGYDLIALNAAGSGHAGGTLSIMDVAAALYLHVARHDPENADWPDRDRIVWSAGHKAPALYVALGMAGYFPIEDVVRLRRLYSPYQGHPHRLKLAGVEASTGSLGQGLSVAVGIALATRLDKRASRVYCITGDGEQQEGQVWEAAMEAGNFALDNLCCVLDRNRLQIDGWVKEVQNIEPIADKYRAFGWNVTEIDGHNMHQVLAAFEKAAKVTGRPTLIIANTTKGKGVSFMENVAGWHGRAPNDEELHRALKELNLDFRLDSRGLKQVALDYQAKVDAELAARVPKFGRDYFWNRQDAMQVEMKPTRTGFGQALETCGADPRTIAIGADISGSILISKFYECDGSRCDRWISVGIAEQSGTALAAGLAREGKLPVFGTYGVFAAGRNIDQIRTTVAYGDFRVLIAGAHGGVSVGPDGATHQALEDLFNVLGIPGMRVAVPCDSHETRRATEHLLMTEPGPKYLRFAREATPVITTSGTPWQWGVPNVYRYRGERPRFIDAFSVSLATDYADEKEDLAIVACGPMVPEALRAAWILKEEFGLETRVLNCHTLKPLDPAPLIAAARETGIVLTAEEHQVGALAGLAARALLSAPELYGRPLAFGSIGVKDRFGESGQPWELMWEFEVSGEHIAQKAKALVDATRGAKKPAKKPAARKAPAAKKATVKKPARQPRAKS
jgi:transketolase